MGGGGGRGRTRGRGGNGAAPAAAENQAPPATPAAPVDEWDRYYALNVMDASARPVLLTTTDGLIEDRTSIALSGDGKTFYYCTNAKDIERRHIWAVPVGGGTPVQITTRRRRRDLSGSARVRQVPRDPQRQLEHAAVARDLEDRNGGAGQWDAARRRSSSRPRGPAFRWTRT